MPASSAAIRRFTAEGEKIDLSFGVISSAEKDDYRAAIMSECFILCVKLHIANNLFNVMTITVRNFAASRPLKKVKIARRWAFSRHLTAISIVLS